MNDLIIEQRAFGIEHPIKRIYSLAKFDREYTVGEWNRVIELKIRGLQDWSFDYKRTRKAVETYFAKVE